MSEIQRLEKIVKHLTAIQKLIKCDEPGSSFIFVLESKIRAYNRRINRIKVCGC